MVLSNVVFVVTVLSSSSVLSQACVQVSACLANVSCGAVAAFDLVYRSLSVLWFYFVLDVSLKLSKGRYRFVSNADTVWL